MIRLLLAGPPGVGKTAVADMLWSRLSVPHVDLDELRRSEGLNVPPELSLSGLDLTACLAPYLAAPRDEVVFDVGGDTVFRRGVKVMERIAQVDRLKRDFGMTVVLLTAREHALRQRFLGCKGRTPDDFDRAWLEWRNLGALCWAHCADRVVDTTSHSIDDTQQAELLMAAVLDIEPPESSARA